MNAIHSPKKVAAGVEAARTFDAVLRSLTEINVEVNRASRRVDSISERFNGDSLDPLDDVDQLLVDDPIGVVGLITQRIGWIDNALIALHQKLDNLDHL